MINNAYLQKIKLRTQYVVFHCGNPSANSSADNSSSPGIIKKSNKLLSENLSFYHKSMGVAP